MASARSARYVVLTLCACLLTQASSQAYKKEEHRALSTVALAIALRVLESPSGDALSAADAKEISDAFLADEWGRAVRDRVADECKDATYVASFPFGQLTAAVDRVAQPSGLVVDERLHTDSDWEPRRAWTPERCRPIDEAPVESIASFLDGLGAEPRLGAAEIERRKFEQAACRAQRKSRGFLTWLLAAHRNASHFEACAASAYTQLHSLAVEEAIDRRGEPEWWRVALITEAVALHYLQDGFAPGHLLTARSQSTDLVARILHNRYNRDALDLHLSPEGDLAMFARELQELIEDGESNLVVAGATETLQLSEHCSMAGCDLSRPVGLLGDDGVAGMPAVALTLFGALSVAEVLRAGVSSSAAPLNEDTLGVDFSPWGAPAKPRAGTRVDESKLRRPALVFGPARSTAELWRGLEVEALGAYRPATTQTVPAETPENREKSADPTTRRSPDRFVLASPRNPELAGAVVFGDSDQHSGIRAELGLIAGGPSDNDIHHLDEVDQLTADTFERLDDPTRAMMGISLLFNAIGEEWEDYEALGGSVRAWLLSGRFHRLEWNYHLGVETGWKWYFADRRDASRFVWGPRFAVGLGLVFVETGFERGSRIRPDGELERNTSYSLGLRFQVP